MNTSISTTNLSDRVKNALHDAGIHTVEKLKATPFEQLKLIRHIGKRSLTEIEDFCYDEDFLQDDEDSQPLMASQATLRDYFAAKAMTAVILMENKAHREGYMCEGWQGLASDCYNWADAMLKARNNEE